MLSDVLRCYIISAKWGGVDNDYQLQLMQLNWIIIPFIDGAKHFPMKINSRLKGAARQKRNDGKSRSEKRKRVGRKEVMATLPVASSLTHILTLQLSISQWGVANYRAGWRLWHGNFEWARWGDKCGRKKSRLGMWRKGPERRESSSLSSGGYFLFKSPFFNFPR